MNFVFKIILPLFLLLTFSISCENEFRKTTIETNDFLIEVAFKDSLPIYQKVFHKKEIVGIDSIIGDTMYSYVDGKLRRKGEWAYAENDQLIFKNWFINYYDISNTFDLVEFGEVFIPETQFHSVNQIYHFHKHKLDSLESQFLKIDKLESGEDYIFLNSRDKEGMHKRSFLFGDNLRDVGIHHRELKDGLNILEPPIELENGIRYEIWTFFIKNINDTIDFDNSSTMYIDYNAELNRKTNQRNDSFIESILNK